MYILRTTTTEYYAILNKKETSAKWMYYYNSLSEQNKQVYNIMLNCYENMQTSVQIGAYRLTEDGLDELFRMISRDNPEIFWIEGSYQYTISQATGLVQSFSPKYRMDIITRNAKREEIIKAERYFLEGIRFSMTPYEKALRLYENIPRLISYDHDATVGERKKQRQTKLDDCSTIYGALVLQKAVCGGYAKAYQYLLKKLGIHSIIVNGDTGRGRHSWNLVLLENEWFHVDVTWGDLIKSFTDGHISYAWFCLPDREVSPLRTWDKDLPLPVCYGNSQNYYVKNKLFFLLVDYDKIYSCIDREIAMNKYRKVQLRFSNSATMIAVWDYLICENKIFTLYKKNNILAKTIWHNMDEDLNVLTFWTEI